MTDKDEVSSPFEECEYLLPAFNVFFMCLEDPTDRAKSTKKSRQHTSVFYLHSRDSGASIQSQYYRCACAILVFICFVIW